MLLPTRKLGSQGCEAAAIGLGCMSLVPGGGLYAAEGLTEEQVIAVIHRALDLGVTLVGRGGVGGGGGVGAGPGGSGVCGGRGPGPGP